MGPGGCGAGQPPEQCVSLTPVFVRQHGHAEHMLPVTGVQGCAFPHVLPRSPDWCAQQKGPVLEVSSCAYDRWYFHARKQNQTIWWTALFFQAAWNCNCKVRSFMLSLQNCEWNLNISFNQNFFLNSKLCMKCIYLHSDFSLWSELLRILLRWTNDCSETSQSAHCICGCTHKCVLRRKMLFSVHAVSPAGNGFTLSTPLENVFEQDWLCWWRISWESSANVRLVCVFVMSVIWWLLVDGEGLGENLLLPLCGTVLVRWEGCWYQVLASWPINDDCGKLV